MDPDLVSAVDDSGASIIFGFSGPARLPSNVGPPVLQQQSVTRPRSGRWTVANTAFASAIDDGCPTELNMTRGSSGHGAVELQGQDVQPLGGDVVTKLRKTAAKQQKDRLVAAAETAAVAQDAPATFEPAKAETTVPSKPKGFFIPKTLGKGIRIVAKDGKDDIVKKPAVKPVPQEASAKPIDPPAKAEQRPAAGPAPKPSSAVSRVSNNGNRGVRIVGKNGAEVFEELPVIRAASNAGSHVYVPTVAKTSEKGA